MLPARVLRAGPERLANPPVTKAGAANAVASKIFRKADGPLPGRPRTSEAWNAGRASAREAEGELPVGRFRFARRRSSQVSAHARLEGASIEKIEGRVASR